MAWNRQSEEKKVEVEKRGGQWNVHFKGLLAGAAIVLGAAAAAWWLWPEGGATVSSKPPYRNGLIKEVKPAEARPPVAAAKPKKTQAEINDEFIRKCEAKYGADMPAGLKAHIHYLKNPPKTFYKAKREFPYLTNKADRDIAGILYTNPGTFFIDCPEFGESFDQAFVESLLSPLKAEDGDSDEAREVKAFVNDMRHQIAALVKSEGVKPSTLMNEQAKMLYDLGRFEEQLAVDLRRAEEDPTLTDDDVRDMFAAANVLRKKKGLEERGIPKLTGRALELKRRLRREARQSAKNAETGKQEGKTEGNKK